METPKGNHLQGSNLEMDGRSGMLQSATHSFIRYTIHTDSRYFTYTKKPLYLVGTAEEAEMKV